MKTYKFESCTARLAARASLAAYEDNKEDMHIDGVTFRKIKDNGKIVGPFRIKPTLSGNWLEEPDRKCIISLEEKTKMCGEKTLVCVVAFRGTKSMKDFLTDATWGPVEAAMPKTKQMQDICTSHPRKTTYARALRGVIGNHYGGFHNRYLEYRENVTNKVIELHKKYKFNRLLVTGHSLGAAVGTICFMDLFKLREETDEFDPCDMFLITFGSPRPGDEEFKKNFSEVLDLKYAIGRFVRSWDPVPQLPTKNNNVDPVSIAKAAILRKLRGPPDDEYAHVCEKIELEDTLWNGVESWELKNPHTMEDYYELVKKWQCKTFQR